MIDIRNGSITCQEKVVISRHIHLAEIMSAYSENGPAISGNPYMPSIKYVSGFTTTCGGLKFEVTAQFKDDEIDYAILKPIEGPASTASWEEVSKNLLKEEIQMIEHAVEIELGRSPVRKAPLHRLWRFAWGEIEAVAETKSFQCGLFVYYRNRNRTT